MAEDLTQLSTDDVLLLAQASMLRALDAIMVQLQIIPIYWSRSGRQVEWHVLAMELERRVLQPKKVEESNE